VSGLLDGLGTTDALINVFSDRSILDGMLRFEVALARVQASLGLIPNEAAEAIASSAAVDEFDGAAIARDARASGTITIPLVKRLTSRVAARDQAAAAFVHRGATSQDVSDTALILCVVRAQVILRKDHDRVTAALRNLSDAHAASVMLARTLLQPAPPITFGLKAAGWFGAVSRCGERVRTAFAEASVVQFGGAVGTLAASGTHGDEIATGLARELGLRAPEAPWHAHRDRLGFLAAACGVYTGVLGKIARDISLLMQQEVAEVSESGGGSSTMPHKRNPSGCAIALAAATRVPGLVSSVLSGMPQEHERGLGNWHAEAGTIAAIVQATGAALNALAHVLESLQVDPQRMRANIAATGDVVFAERAKVLLTEKLGADATARVIASAIESARHGGNFVDALIQQPSVATALELDEPTSLRDPEAYLGSAEQFRSRLIQKPQ
jgi:3-carboxy-cis,cis-muconate cycloisomerase